MLHTEPESSFGSEFKKIQRMQTCVECYLKPGNKESLFAVPIKTFKVTSQQNTNVHESSIKIALRVKLDSSR